MRYTENDKQVLEKLHEMKNWEQRHVYESPILPTETNLINRGISDYENGLTINGKESLKKMRERHGLL